MAWQNGVGQGVVLSGKLIDTTAGRSCAMVIISLLHEDSSLIRFTHSGKNGSFRLAADVPTGVYLLFIEHPSFIPLYRRLFIDRNTAYDMGVIVLIPKTDSLQPVTITPRDFRPHFRRDTLEYNTANIKMNVNANVEEMIGRLPGLQVDPDGNITYNGQKIQQVLVDGREIFGSNLTLVTRNLNADMIGKIQVIDSKSKQSQFTGIDDGQRVRTLNLILKEDRHGEYFVKAGAGEDPNGYYQLGGVLGSFNGKEQLMVIGAAADNGNSSFSGSAGGMSTNVFINGATNDPLGASAGTGIPSTIGGAADYANDFGPDRLPINGYYHYGHLITHPYSSSLSEQIIPDSIYIQNQENKSVNSQYQQGFETDFTYNLDSLSAFQVRFVAANMHGNNLFSSTGSGAFNDTLTNTSIRTLSSDVTNQRFLGNVLWRLCGRRNRNRILSVMADFSGTNNATGGYLYSIDRYYQTNGAVQSIDTTDQRMSVVHGEFLFNGGANYTEPLWDNVVLGLSYGLTINNTHQQQFTYDRGDGKYQDLVDSLSGNYQDIFVTQRGGLSLQGQGNSYDFVFGGDVLQYNYREQDLLNDSVIKYQYLNFAPRLMVNLRPNSSTGYSVSYSGSTQLPSITQLQPVQNNTNPLYITLGNPNLHPSYTNTFSLGYHRTRATLFNMGVNFAIINNSISTKTYTDSLGRQVSQQVNTSGSVNADVNASINKKLKSLDLNVSLNGSFSYSRAVSYINTFLADNDTYTAGGGFSLAKYVTNAYNFRINTNFSYSTTTSSINTGTVVGYWTQNHVAQVGIFPLKDWEVGTSLNYTWRQKTPIFANNNSVVLWNVFVNRNFLDNRLTARFQVNDILGQNTGISRSISANQISQTNSNVIGRYWMLSLQYQFNHKLKSR